MPKILCKLCPRPATVRDGRDHLCDACARAVSIGSDLAHADTERPPPPSAEVAS